MKIKLLLIFFLTLTGILFASLNSTKVSAATVTWLGYNSSDWSDDGNWDVPLQEGDDLFFPYDGSYYMNCESNGKVFKSLTFDDSYELTCPYIYLSESLTHYSARSVIYNTQFVLEGNVIMNTEAHSHINQSINLNGHDLTLNVDFTYLQVSGFIGNGNVKKTNDYPLRLVNNSLFTGTFILESGVTNANVSNALSPNSSISMSNGELVLADATTNTTKGLSGNGVVTIGNNAVLNLEDDSVDFEFEGEIASIGTLNKKGLNNVTFSGESDLFNGVVNVLEGNFIVDGDMSGSSVVIDGGKLSGNGTLKEVSISTNASTLSPGHDGIGILSFTEDVELKENTTLLLTLLGNTAGSGYGQLHAGGNIYLNNANLVINPDFVPTPGDQFILVHTSGGAIDGVFSNIPNNSELTLDGNKYTIEYTNDTVILSAITTPNNTVFTVSPTFVNAGQPFVVTSAWTGSASIPTGSGELFAGSTSLGNVNLVNGVATFNVSGLISGNYQLHVVYSGDTVYSGGVSSHLALEVKTVVEPQPNFSDSNQSLSQSIYVASEASPQVQILVPVSYSAATEDEYLAEDVPVESIENSITPIREENNLTWPLLLLLILLIFIIVSAYFLYRKSKR